MLQDHVGFTRVIVQHLRFFVEAAANAVTAVFAHHGETFRFNEFLNRRANFAQVHARLHHFERQVQALLGNAAQTFAENGRSANDEHF